MVRFLVWRCFRWRRQRCRIREIGVPGSLHIRQWRC